MALQALFAAVAPALIGAASSAFGAKKQNEAAEAASQKQMDFQERMSNTQYQRAMADMKKAGLNPMLAYKQGGAGTPGGSTYSPVNVGAAAAAGAGAGSTTAIAARRARLDRHMLIAGIDTLYTQAGKNSSEDSLAYQNRLNAMKQGEILQQQKLMNQPFVNSAATAAKFWLTPAGKRAVVIDLLGRSVNPMIESYKKGQQ